jgi:HK97 family phage portal protein
MGIIDRFVEGYMKRKGLNPYPFNQPKIQGINNSILQQYGADSYVSEGYLNNSDVYAIVSFLARKAGSIPWYVYKMKPGAKAQTALHQYKQLTKGLQNKGAYEQALIKRKSAYEENMVTNSPLAKLLEQPNPQQAQDQFFENLYGYRILSGEGNIYGNDGGIEGAKFVELNVLPTQLLDIYPDPKDLYGLLGYKLMVGAGLDLPKEQVCQWKSWNPEFNADTRTHMRGLSPLRPGFKLLRMSNNAADASAAMTANGGAKGAIVPRPVNNSIPSLTPEQASLVQRMVNDRVNNKDQKGAIGVFQTPWDYLNFGLSSVDMELVKTMQMTLHQWCRLFGLPVVLFDTDSSSYNNYSNAMRDLITNTIMPLNCQLRDELNKWLVPRFGEDVYIDFDISALPEMQKDMEQMVNQLRMADWLTFDEKREAMNYEALGGAYAFSYVNQGLLPLEQVNMDLTVSNDQSGNMDNGNSQIS